MELLQPFCDNEVKKRIIILDSVEEDGQSLGAW